MTAPRVVLVLLALLLAAVQAQLWFGWGGVARVTQLQTQLAKQDELNVQARARNARVEAELRDLREGLEMVEEKARHDLGMLKPDEIYIQVAAQ